MEEGAGGTRAGGVVQVCHDKAGGCANPTGFRDPLLQQVESGAFLLGTEPSERLSCTFSALRPGLAYFQ